MKAETRHRIFEPFFTTKEKGRGTGLGLSTVMGILQMSGGHILVDSKQGAGTIVDALLPCVDDDARDGRTAKKKNPEGGSETILVVEDDEQVRQLVTLSLRKLGYNVLVAGNGSEALEISANYDAPADLVLTDVIMPGLNGRQVAQALRETRQDIRVIFASGYADDILTKEGDSIAYFPLIDKPFDMHSLASLIRKTLDSV